MATVIQTTKEYVRLLQVAAVRDTVLVFIGNASNAALGFIVNLLVARTMGPEEFGLYTSAIAAGAVVISLSDLGINTGVVRFASKYLNEQAENKAFAIFYSALKFRLVLGVLLTIVGVGLSRLIAQELFDEPRLTILLQISFFGLLIPIISGLFGAIFQVYREFKKSVFLGILGGTVNLTYVGLLWLLQRMTLINLIAGSVLLAGALLFVTGSFLPKNIFSVRKTDSILSRNLYHFSKWIMISSISVVLANNLDYYMLLWFRGAEAVGTYAAAWKLGYVFPILAGAMGTVLLPHVSSFETKERMKQYLTKAFRVTLPIAILTWVLIPIAQPLINLIFGSEYMPAIPVFKILIIAFSITIVINPLGLVVYSLNKPHYFSIMNLVQLAVTIIGNIVLIPIYGIIGPAITVLLTGIVAIIFVSIIIGRYFYGPLADNQAIITSEEQI